MRDQGASIRQLRRALACRKHLDDLLVGLAVFFEDKLPPEERARHSFRVGLYIAENRVMRPLHGVKSDDPTYNPFTSYQTHEQFFHLDSNSHVSHTVRCVRGQCQLIVPDCAEAQARGELVFFNAQQPTYLKSLAACYIGKVCRPGGEMAEAAVVLDTNKAGFFKHEDAETIRFAVNEFAARYGLELSLIALTAERRRTENGRPVQPEGPGQDGPPTGPAGQSNPPGNPA
jgi:hypothetical protein